MSFGPSRLSGPRTLPEAAFQSQVTELAETLRWKWMHAERVTVRRRQRDGSERTYAQTPLVGPLGPGWPDLVLVRERIVYAELKSDRGSLTAEQEEVRNVLRGGGAEWYRWAPRDWDEVVAVLTRRSA